MAPEGMQQPPSPISLSSAILSNLKTSTACVLYMARRSGQRDVTLHAKRSVAPGREVATNSRNFLSTLSVPIFILSIATGFAGAHWQPCEASTKIAPSNRQPVFFAHF
jgi:hypothetical protein